MRRASVNTSVNKNWSAGGECFLYDIVVTLSIGGMKTLLFIIVHSCRVCDSETSTTFHRLIFFSTSDENVKYECRYSMPCGFSNPNESSKMSKPHFHSADPLGYCMSCWTWQKRCNWCLLSLALDCFVYVQYSAANRVDVHCKLTLKLLFIVTFGMFSATVTTNFDRDRSGIRVHERLL